MKRKSTIIACALLLGMAAIGATGCGSTTSAGNGSNGSGTASSTTAQQPADASKPSGISNEQAQAQAHASSKVQVAANAGDASLTQALVNYFNKMESRMDGATGITVKKLTSTGQDGNNATAEVTLGVTLDANAKSSGFKSGDNTLYVLFNKSGGVWDVNQVSKSPIALSKAPTGTSDFAKAAKKVEGTITDIQLFTDKSETTGKDVVTLAGLDLKVASGGSFQAGETVHVDFVETLPDGAPVKPQKGDKITVWVGPNDPRAAAGMKGWISHTSALFVSKDGTYYNINGQTVTSTDLK